jgi:hypothetical protein
MLGRLPAQCCASTCGICSQPSMQPCYARQSCTCACTLLFPTLPADLPRMQVRKSCLYMMPCASKAGFLMRYAVMIDLLQLQRRKGQAASCLVYSPVSLVSHTQRCRQAFSTWTTSRLEFFQSPNYQVLGTLDDSELRSNDASAGCCPTAIAFNHSPLCQAVSTIERWSRSDPNARFANPATARWLVFVACESHSP